MKLCLLSDTHGFLPEVDADTDVILHAGDVTPVFDHSLQFQLSWLTTNFKNWLNEHGIPTILVAGNHDFIFEDKAAISLELPCIYLYDSGTKLGGYKIWGSPWQPPFYDWAFNLPESELEKKWALIPDDTEILITHGPPKNIRDREGRNESHVGSRTLLERTFKLPNLKLHVFGHIHHDFGQVEIAEAQFVNASYVDEGYQPRHNAPIYLTLPER